MQGSKEGVLELGPARSNTHHLPLTQSPPSSPPLTTSDRDGRGDRLSKEAAGGEEQDEGRGETGDPSLAVMESKKILLIFFLIAQGEKSSTSRRKRKNRPCIG